MMKRATEAFIVFVVMLNLFIVFVFGNCLLWETVNANSATPPPNTFQWSKARVCGCRKMADYFR
jgi:hypothetical protein